MKRLVLASLAAILCAAATTTSAQVDVETDEDAPVPFERAQDQKPLELHLQRGRSSNIDLRNLPQTPPTQRERPEREIDPHPVELPGGPRAIEPTGQNPLPSAPAPAPNITFDGLDRANFGQGYPPIPTATSARPITSRRSTPPSACSANPTACASPRSRSTR